MDENKQQNLSDISEILQVLQSLVYESFVSKSESKSQEDHLAENIFPVISCFASVIQFVKKGSVNIPQVLVHQFLEVAKILNIVQEESVKEEDIHEFNGDNVDEEYEDHEEEVRDDYWWDDSNKAQYQLYWDNEFDEVFSTGSCTEEDHDEEDLSIAHRVKVRRCRLGAASSADRVSPPPASTTLRRCGTASTSPPSSSSSPPPGTSRRRKSRGNIGCDPFISAILRTIGRTSPKSVYNQHRAEILKKERSEERISNVVPDELRTLWDTLDEEEEVKIIVPDPYPTIDWTKVNKRFISNVPEPSRFPIHSCSPDPAFYEWTEKKINGSIEKIPSPFERYHYYLKKGWFEAAKGMHAFGSRWGYDTSEGIVSVASLVHHGYIWQNGWILHAQKPNLEVKIPRKRSSEDCKFQSQKKKFGGRKRAAQNLSSMPD